MLNYVEQSAREHQLVSGSDTVLTTPQVATSVIDLVKHSTVKIYQPVMIDGPRNLPHTTDFKPIYHNLYIDFFFLL